MRNLYDKRLHFVILIMAMFFISCSCQAPANLSKKEKKVFVTFKSLQAAKQFRITGLKTAGKLHSEGIITDEVARKIVKIGDALQLSINASAVSLKLYKTTGELKDMEDLHKCVKEYELVYGQFTDLVMPYVFKKIGE